MRCRGNGTVWKVQQKGIGRPWWPWSPRPLAVESTAAMKSEHHGRKKLGRRLPESSAAYGGDTRTSCAPRLAQCGEVLEREMTAALRAARGERIAGRFGYRSRANLSPHP